MFKNMLGKQLLFFDGAMATELYKAGLEAGGIPDIWNITHPDIIKDIHRQYLGAGCDIIKTNTFGCSTLGIKNVGGYSAAQIAAVAVNNAKSAAADFSISKPRFIALDIGPTGKLLKPLGDLCFEDAVGIFAETIKVGADKGADLILIETMSDAYELKAAVLAAKETCSLPVIASVTLDKNGKLMTGGGVDVVAALLEGLGVDAIGLNCGFGIEQLTEYVTHLLGLSSTPVLFMPNAGLPHNDDGHIIYNTAPEKFAELLRKSAENGVWLLGGCCGTTPAHIKSLVAECRNAAVPSVMRKSLTVASSCSKTVVFGEKTVIVGERINPTGKPKLKKALKDGDFEYALREGIAQAEQGADVLDVNVGIPGIDEAAVLKELIEKLQAVTDIPLQIDTADINAVERAMRIYNGKPVINSVNGKQSSMDTVFPLVKKYGGIVVALTLDENGIPETAQGRIDIAKKILKQAEQYGISREEFLFDPLTMAISAGKNYVPVTLQCVKRLKEELNVKTILGISNISFGLPNRENLNKAFLSLALEAGIDAAIINPQSIGQLIKSKESRAENNEHHEIAINALLGKDRQFKSYIEFFGMHQDTVSKGTPEHSSHEALTAVLPLGEAVLKGLKTQAQDSARLSLTRLSPLEVIEQELVPALNTAGERFEQGSMYLPQLLMCAEAAKSAFGVIREIMGSTADGIIGTVILATVEGDIHDIGKNIVRALLENYRFHVVDLGKDVPVQTIVEAVKKHNAKLVGLSALMTTTVASMEKTILALRKAAIDCKIMCGGAVLTEEYAKQIGADCYVKDAMASVRYAQEIFGKNTGTSKNF